MLHVIKIKSIAPQKVKKEKKLTITYILYSYLSNAYRHRMSWFLLTLPELSFKKNPRVGKKKEEKADLKLAV